MLELQYVQARRVPISYRIHESLLGEINIDNNSFIDSEILKKLITVSFELFSQRFFLFFD